MNRLSPRLRGAMQALAVALALGALVTLSGAAPGYFVGDSADYYALYLAWKDTLRPFMTEPSWAEYARRAAAEAWYMPVPLDSARGAARAFTLGASADFAHFWFYSLLAATIGRSLEYLGVQLQIHTAFVTLHWALLTMACLLARRHFGWTGLAAALVLTLLSPIIWFVDKVHTEFFTFAFALSAVIVFLRGAYLQAAFFLAVASTQNISFGAVALVPLLMGVWSRRRAGYAFVEVAMVVAIVALLALHPAYYFFRHGVIEPQLLGGGANPGVHLGKAAIWFLDLDIGLFSNWPLGLGLLLLGAWIKLKGASCAQERGRWLLFVLAYVGISLFAQSSTNNLNSGGTRSIARYATWYLPLFFPLVTMALEWARAGDRVFRAAAGALIVAGGAYNLGQYHPGKSENARAPTLVSSWVQTYLPYLYDPPAEIFSERFGGIGESWDLNRALAVVGPDCRKILIFFQPGRTDVLGGQGCGLDSAMLGTGILQRVASSGLRAGEGYATLHEEEIEAARFRCPSRIEFGERGAPASAFSGFGLPEGRGRWSEGSHASFTCWLAPVGERLARIQLSMAAFVHKGHAQRVLVSVNGGPPHEISYEREWDVRRIELELPPMTFPRLQVRFNMPDAVSPRQLGSSPDPRRLGVWVEAMELQRP